MKTLRVKSGKSAATEMGFIPFNRASLQGGEIHHIRQAMEVGHVAGDRRFSKLCQSLLEKETGCQRALLTTSCTHALEMAALLLDLQPGDEVVIPDFTFVSTANAFALRGARPVFGDIRPDTLNLDETKLPGLISSRTKAIVVVHYAGVGCEMDGILKIAKEHGIPVIEDNAHGLFGRYRGKNLGTFGVMAALSFHETKNITCGEGGALLINDPRYVERAEIIREKGTDRSKYFRGEIDKYSWVDLGSSYVMSDVLAAFLLGQLEHAKAIQAKRHALWNHYHKELAGWTEANGVRQPMVPVHCEHAAHMYYLLMPSLESRTRFISRLEKSGMSAVFHYLPLHLSRFAARWGGRPGDCPVTESVSDRLVRLPFFTKMSARENERVISEITNGHF